MDTPPSRPSEPPHPLHVPVLLEEIVESLLASSPVVVVDATVGAGGHARGLLRRMDAGARLVGLDRDPRALDRARTELEGDPRVVLRRARFSKLASALDDLGLPRADAFLLDLGVSSMQLDDGERGMSFLRDGPLDLRMAPDEGGRTAADLVARLPERELADLVYRLGEERASRRVARAIVERRKRARIERTADLAEIVRRAVPWSKADARRIHPATRTFQALRIAVNDELGELEAGLDAALARLAPGGRIAVLAYHSLEDRIVKERFRLAAGQGFERVTRKPVRPSEREVASNPRARSARLRILERIPGGEERVR